MAILREKIRYIHSDYSSFSFCINSYFDKCEGDYAKKFDDTDR